jgi:DNA-binding CsgD family transcriptional regulator
VRDGDAPGGLLGLVQASTLWDDAAGFDRFVLDAARELVRCDLAGYHRGGDGRVTVVPSDSVPPDAVAQWSHLVAGHELLAVFDGVCRRQSEVLAEGTVSPSRRHASVLERLGIRHLLVFGLRFAGSRIDVVWLGRAGPDFDERDEWVLETLRPHLLRTRRTLIRQELTEREVDVLDLLGGGRSNVEIARALAISPGTVRKHVERLFTKLGVSSRTAVAGLALDVLGRPPRPLRR